MPLPAGSRLGPYEILAPIGAGGMGEVYRARDTRLDRTVAVKVLASHLSSSPEIRQRFEREARAISSLNHPNICTLHDIGNQDGVDYLVMEHLEGESLDDRLKRGPLTAPELLRCAIDVADALDRAHRQGLIHRDLKPGNIMLTKAGAKLLDFGLARTLGMAAAPTQLTASPTMTTPLTAEGKIVGTFQYMAPEQLAGKEADTRTDIFAFGAVLYEMATGSRAFSGDTQAMLIASILKDEPRQVGSLAPHLPPALQRIISGCLAKDPDDRWQSAGDLKRELKWIAEGASATSVSGSAERPAPAAHQATPAPSRGLPLRLAVPAALLLGAALFAAGFWLRPVEAPGLLRAALPLIEGSTLDTENLSLALSPDGRALAFVAWTQESRARIWVRPLDSAQAQPLIGTEGASYPFWSPDGRTIGFFADGKLKKIAASGGAAQTLCEAPDGRGASWGAKGVIAFSPAPFGGLSVVSASGGTPSPLTTPDTEGTTHRLPHFLPDGGRLLFFSGNAPSEKDNAIMSLDLASRKVALVTNENSGPQIAPSSHLAFVREGNLMLQPLDMETLKPAGEAVPIAEGITFNPNRWTGQYTFSNTGLLAYQAGSTQPLAQLTLFDLEGKSIAAVGEPAPILQIALSPDGRRAATTVAAGTSADIWNYDLARGVATRFTFAASGQSFNGPAWSPDSRLVAFANENGHIFVKAVDGSGNERTVLAGTPANREPNSWSPDGRDLSVMIQSGSSYDQWIVPIDNQEGARPLIASPASDYYGRFSPDGRWFAYISHESGRGEAYVVPFPGPGGKWQISTAGARDVRWLGAALQILYQTPEGRLMAVELVASGASLEVGKAQPQFGGKSLNSPFDLLPGGDRVLAAIPVGQPGTPAVSLVVNWSAALAQR